MSHFAHFIFIFSGCARTEGGLLRAITCHKRVLAQGGGVMRICEFYSYFRGLQVAPRLAALPLPHPSVCRIPTPAKQSHRE